MVAPFAGAWIEILIKRNSVLSGVVAPFAGAWIEILVPYGCMAFTNTVAPFAGAWIEITIFPFMFCLKRRRTLCGCVD